MAVAVPPPRGELEVVPGQVEDFVRGPVVIISPLFTASVFVNPETVIFAGLGLSLAIARDAPAGFDAASLVAGNPSLGVAWRLGEGLAAKLLVTVPLASRSAWGDGLGEVAESAARGLRGHIDPWLWLADHFAAVATISWATSDGDYLIEVLPSFAVMLPTKKLVVDPTMTIQNTRFDRGDGFAVQVRARVGLRLWSGLWFAVGGNVVWAPTVERDSDQWSLSPELRWTFDDGAYLAASGLFNLDGPWGPSFGSGWTGLRLAGSWRF